MSEEISATQPQAEHAWLEHFIGEWSVRSVMQMNPDDLEESMTGTESVRSLGGLWAFSEGRGDTSGGPHQYRSGLGYDVSFKEYRGFWISSMSSHLWKYTGELSEDGRTMTLTCEGPDMVHDGKTAWYRDVHHLVDANHRTMTSSFQGPDGQWVQFLVSTYERL